MKIKQFLLFTLLVFLFVGIVSAGEVFNETSSHYSETTDINENEVYSSVMPENGINTIEEKLPDKSIVTDEVQENKMETRSDKIIKNEIKNVTCYQDLVYAFEEAELEEYDNYMINLLSGDYDATANITWNTSATKTIILNGNGNTLDGEDLYSFIQVGEGHNLTLENIILINYKSSNNGIICNYGTLSIINCTFNNTKVSSFEGVVYNVGNLTISDSVFQNNSGKNGRTIYNKKGNVTVTNSTFYNNMNSICNEGSLNLTECILNNNSGGDGGAIYNSYGDLIINNCTLNNNMGFNGATTYNWKGNVIINNSAFNNNRATNGYSRGGAVYNYEESILTITHCIFNNNSATDNGGAIFSLGISDITDSTFNNNSATNDGGAIFSRGSSNITNSIFHNNSATKNGGAIYSGGTLIINNSTFNNNNITNTHVDETDSNYKGGSIYSTGGLIISNSSFNNNYAIRDGGAIYSPNYLVVKNTTFNNNYAVNYGGAIYSSYNLIVNGSTFNNNTAGNDGGAIFALNDYEINDTVFYKNTPIDFFINETNQIEPRTFNEDSGNNNYYLTCQIIVNDFSIIVDGVEAYHGYGIDDLSNYVISPDSLTVDLILNSTVDNRSRTNNIFTLRKSKEINVECYQELLDVIEDAKNDKEYNKYTINLMGGDYNATEIINLADSNIKIITINGNGITLDGQNSCQFIKISSDFNLTLENIILTEYVEFEGGAIYNTGTLSMINSTLKNNNATYFGGAVYNSGNLTITDCTFQNNHADNGGAIINYGNSFINGSTFKYNNATHGSAITNFENITIEKNTFIANAANDTGEVILDFKYNAIIRDNKNDDTSKYSSTIYTIGRTVRITNNIFYDELNTTITISTNNTNPKVKDKIKINFLLKDQLNNTISSENVNITINYEKYNIITDNEGVASLEYVPINNNTVNINAAYYGNYKYIESRANVSFNVEKLDITITYDPITNIKYKDNITITGKITDITGKALYNINALITINEKLYKAKTNSIGAFTLTTTANNIGTNNITIAYNGNDKYNSFQTNTTFNVEKQDIIITHNPIQDTQYNDDVTITGKITDKNFNGLYNINALITINGKLYKAKTDSTGAFTLTTTANNIGTNNVTISYGGNANYNSNETNTTFQVEKQDIIITYDTITDTKYKDNITITGKVTDVNGKGLYNINAIIEINGKLFKAKTDKTGAFTLITTATKTGINDVTISYGGNAKYNGYEVNTAFNVEKQDIIITYNPIQDTFCGDNVSITGKVTDINGKSLKYINTHITLNGELYKAKTDSSGAFVLTATVNQTGFTNVTISYAGNTNYNGYETITTFNVIEKSE